MSAQSFVEHALAISSADDCVVVVRDHTSANLRWANNTLTTNGVMHGLDVTHQALVTPDRLEAIRGLGTPLSGTVVELLEFYSIYDQTRRGRMGAPLHDPCVIAYLLNPGLFRGRSCHVAVETRGEHTLGRTVVDWSGRTRHPPNALVINEIDADGFFALMTERLGRLPLPA